MTKMLKMVSKIMMMGVLVFGLAYTALAFSQPVFADCGGAQTSIINCNETDPKSGFFAILGMVLNILTFGVGIATTAGFIFCGYQYMTSKNEPAVIVKIKTRIFNMVIGLLIYAMFWAVIALLLPGGLN